MKNDRRVVRLLPTPWGERDEGLMMVYEGLIKRRPICSLPAPDTGVAFGCSAHTGCYSIMNSESSAKEDLLKAFREEFPLILEGCEVEIHEDGAVTMSPEHVMKMASNFRIPHRRPDGSVPRTLERWVKDTYDSLLGHFIDFVQAWREKHERHTECLSIRETCLDHRTGMEILQIDDPNCKIPITAEFIDKEEEKRIIAAWTAFYNKNVLHPYIAEKGGYRFISSRLGVRVEKV